MNRFVLKNRALCAAVVLVCAGACVGAWAQADPAGAAQRSIEDSQSRLPARPARSLAADLTDVSGAVSLDRLEVVEVRGPSLADDIRAYWQPFMGKPVSEEQVIAFKTWFNGRARANGFLGYAQTDAEGGRLIVTQVVPTIASIRVFASNEELARRYESQLNARFAAAFKPGAPIDVQALEQQLDALSFYMPLDLDVVIRTAGPEKLELVVNINEMPSRAGQLLGGLVQANNHGLRLFGRAQLLGQLTVGGHTPGARLTLTGQKSEGIDYGRADYDMPAESLQGRLRLAAGHVQSQSIRSQRFTGNTTDVGLGYDRILGFQNALVFKAAADLAWRQTDSVLSATGAQISRVHDQQLRLRWSADSDRLSSEPMRAEVSGVLGHYSRVEGLDDVKPGRYFKLEAQARKQMNLSADGSVFGLARVRGQYSSRQLDGFNRMSLGGVSGVRAYTTADGVGNDAVLGSLELNFRSRPNEYAGVFYDAGWVRPPRTVDGQAPGYRLQAMGYQIVGNVGRFYYNWTIAKGVGGNRGALPTDIESAPNNLRLSVSGTYVF